MTKSTDSHAPAPLPERRYPAIRGVQAGHQYYAIFVKLGDLAILLDEVDPKTPVHERAQRALVPGRVPKIARYVLDHPDDYVFGALTGIINGAPAFTPAVPRAKFGELTIPAGVHVSTLDGQHRRAGILAAIGEQQAQKSKSPCRLRDEHIPVVLYEDPGLKRAQTMFVDLNSHASAVARSVTVSFDHRDPHAALARHLVQAVPVFQALTDMERSACSKKSPKLFTIGAIHQATKDLVSLANLPAKAAKKSTVAYWTAVCTAIEAWGRVASSELDAPSVREAYVHGHAVALHAIGRVGGILLRAEGWEGAVAKLGAIDWSRNNPAWEGRAMVGGHMQKSTANVIRTANYLKQHLGLDLSVEDEMFERRGGAPATAEGAGTLPNAAE